MENSLGSGMETQPPMEDSLGSGMETHGFLGSGWQGG